MRWITFFIVACITILLAVASLWWLSKGAPYSIAELRRATVDLLRRGFDGGDLLIDWRFSKEYIYFQKYIRAKGDYGIRMNFPMVGWAQPYLSKLVALLDQKGLQYTVESDETPGLQHQYISVDLGKDADMAHEIVTSILLEVFHVPSGRKFYVRLRHASLRDELIDDV